MFFFNFIFWLMGLLLMGIGIYAIMDKWSSGEAFKLETIFDVIFNIGFLLLIIGFIVFIVSFDGKHVLIEILLVVFADILPGGDDHHRPWVHI